MNNNEWKMLFSDEFFALQANLFLLLFY